MSEVMMLFVISKNDCYFTTNFTRFFLVVQYLFAVFLKEIRREVNINVFVNTVFRCAPADKNNDWHNCANDKGGIMHSWCETWDPRNKRYCIEQ